MTHDWIEIGSDQEWSFDCVDERLIEIDRSVK